LEGRKAKALTKAFRYPKFYGFLIIPNPYGINDSPYNTTNIVLILPQSIKNY